MKFFSDLRVYFGKDFLKGLVKRIYGNRKFRRSDLFVVGVGSLVIEFSFFLVTQAQSTQFL